MGRPDTIKLGLFVSSKNSIWRSCNSISRNLILAYQELERQWDFELVQFAVDFHPEAAGLDHGAFEMARNVVRSGMTDLIFLDHHVDPLPIILALKTLMGPRFNSLRFAFHVYGDFTLYPMKWLYIGKELRGIPLQLICASERQKGVVSFFEQPDRPATVVCPFAVDTAAFRFSSESRQKTRDSLALTASDSLLLYSGRISMQKGVIRLIEEFQKLCAHGNEHLHLGIAGAIDDLGGPTSGLSTPPGYMFHTFTEVLRSLPKHIRRRIHVLGDLSASELHAHYCAADVFISLSLYHDEDFGMAPAEALASGLPALITDWGGYAAFAVDGIACETVPVHLRHRGLEIETSGFAERIAALERPSHSSSRRLKRGQAFAERFGVAAVAARLNAILQPQNYQPCNGFSWTLESLCDAGQLKGGLYREVYGKYVNPRTH